jgi:hypothetical protein
MFLRGIDVSLYIEFFTIGCDTFPVCADKKLTAAKRKIKESAMRFIILPPKLNDLIM